MVTVPGLGHVTGLQIHVPVPVSTTNFVSSENVLTKRKVFNWIFLNVSSYLIQLMFAIIELTKLVIGFIFLYIPSTTDPIHISMRFGLPKLTDADKRPVAFGIGSVAITFMVTFAVLLLVVDANNLRTDFRGAKSSRLRPHVPGRKGKMWQ